MALINFSGIASGIDSEALIKATSDATRSQRITPLEEKVTKLTDTDSALDSLKTKLTTLQTAAKKFASVNGGGVKKLASSSDETKVSAVAGNAALNGTYSFTVNTLAKNGTVSFGPSAGTYSSSSSTISAGATEVIEIGTGSTKETVTIPITAGSTTIGSFVDQFNAQSSKARASLVNVGTDASPDYRIVINSNDTGTADGTIALTSHAAGFAASTASAATDASVTIAGIGTITRPTNSITDIIAGVTVNVRATGSATVSITEDADETISAIEDMLSAWNDIVTYIGDNNKITREESGDAVKNTFAPLSTTRVDDGALTALRSALSASNNGAATATTTIRIFADLGIKTERNGTLSFDTDIFKTALADEPNSVNEILTDFADTVALTSTASGEVGTIQGFIRFNGIIDTTTNANKTQITNLNTRISEVEKIITRNEESLRQKYSRLEAQMGKLQSQQSALTSALGSLG